ncbi:TPM domain-containing protein [uncultured Kosakonia sp.]|uniref:TPM domain-containing protein n=1 Tax=uncultured Kosakonia sp. TaxID=1588927 RepID=UPI000345E2B6|nr:TPM domain-containing protein [uncultured Kosakonia sp.]
MARVVTLLLLFVSLAFQAHALPVPSMRGFVNDPHALFATEDKLSLISEVAEINRRTGAQVAVLVLPSLEGENLETFATQTFNTWRLGSAQRNDGVLILVAWQDRRVRVEVGRGLETTISDALASQVIKEQMLPYFRGGDLLSGLQHGLKGIDALLSGQPLPSPASASWAWVRGKLVNFSYWQGLPFLAVGLFLLILKRRKRTVRVLFFGSLLLTPALAITSEFVSWVMPFVWLSFSIPFISIFSGLFFLWLYPQRLLAVGGGTMRDDSATWTSTTTSHLHHHSGGDSGSHSSSDSSSSGDGGSSDGGGSSDSW